MERRIDAVQLKKYQIDILKTVHRFCIDNKISYWLDSGTLLGAIRHKGYIPWDDDIDIAMLRPDYDKFMRLFNEKNERYKFYTIENNSQFLYPIGKVLDTSTVLYEPNKQGNKLSINIDIFVYDNAPDNDKLVEKMYKKRDLYRRFVLMHSEVRRPNGNLLRRFCVRCLRGAIKLLPSSYY